MRKPGGTPIEEAPVWVLCILAALLGLVVLAALVGVLGSLRGPWGGGGVLAIAAGGISVLLVAGLAIQKRWRRQSGAELVDARPPFVRFSIWTITVFLYPNVLHGALVLFTGGEPWPYGASWALGLLIAAIQGLFLWRSRRSRRKGIGIGADT